MGIFFHTHANENDREYSFEIVLRTKPKQTRIMEIYTGKDTVYLVEIDRSRSI